MAKNSTTARLRKSFRYTNDDNDGHDSDDSLPEIMDEEEQDSFISNLAEKNTSLNASTAKLLLILPLISTIPFLLPPVLHLFAPSSSSSSYSGPSSIFTLVSLSSLLSTTYLIHTLPPEKTGLSFLDSFFSTSSSSSSSVTVRVPVVPALLQGTTTMTTTNGPLQKYLPLLNLGLVVLAGLNGVLEEKTRGAHNGVLLGILPGVVWAVVAGAKVMMASVDPEEELKGLKYGYKGA